MYSEEVIHSHLENEKGIVINGGKFRNISYPDDTVIIPTSKCNLQRLLNNIVKACKDFGMELTEKKAKTNCRMIVNGKELEQ